MKMMTVASLFLGYQWFLAILLGGGGLVTQHPVLCQVDTLM